MTEQATQLWFTETHRVELREQRLGPLKPDEVLVRSQFSAISAGTEMLAYRDQLPENMALDSTIAALSQSTDYPLRFGYACVGVIEQVGSAVASEWIGRTVFAFQPHASHFVCALDQVIPVPESIDALSAVFLANMETAVNLIQDGRPLAGEKVVITGQGVVGLLTASILAEFPLSGLYVIDQISLRRDKSLAMGAHLAFNPENSAEMEQLGCELGRSGPGSGADLVYELSGMPEVLDQAITLCGYDSRIVVGSWYGSKKAGLNLGGAYHRNRIQIISSQVSSIAPELSGRWDKRRRYDVAWQMIEKHNPQQLISHRIPFHDAASAYQLLHHSPADALQIVLTYPEDS